MQVSYIEQGANVRGGGGEANVLGGGGGGQKSSGKESQGAKDWGKRPGGKISRTLKLPLHTS